MALIDCVECGQKVSDKAEYCPNCGCPVNELEYSTDYAETRKVSGWVYLAISTVATVAAAIYIGQSFLETSGDKVTATVVTNAKDVGTAASGVKVETGCSVRVQPEREEAKEWSGASSRGDLRSKIDGTTWETMRPYSVTGLYYRFVISGSSVRWFSARPTRNYDDPKDWGDEFSMTIEDIAEPKQGVYCVICKAVDDDDPRAAVSTIFVFQGKDVRYSLGGDMGPYMKKVEN